MARHIHFQNVTITVLADDAEQAYAKLCEVFEAAARAGWLEYTTDTYQTEGEDSERDTRELFGDAPKPDEQAEVERIARQDDAEARALGDTNFHGRP